MLKNEYLIAKIGFDTAENEPIDISQNLPNFKEVNVLATALGGAALACTTLAAGSPVAAIVDALRNSIRHPKFNSSPKMTNGRTISSIFDEILMNCFGENWRKVSTFQTF